MPTYKPIKSTIAQINILLLLRFFRTFFKTTFSGNQNLGLVFLYQTKT